MIDLKTTIAVSEDLKKRLYALKKRGESYEEVLIRLLEKKREETEKDDWSPVFTAIFEKRGRIWIPKTIREYLGISEGDYVEVKIRLVKRKGLLRK